MQGTKEGFMLKATARKTKLDKEILKLGRRIVHVLSNTCRIKGVARGGSWGARDPPLCKPFCKQTAYNIQVAIW